MPRKGMRSLCFHSKTRHDSNSHNHATTSSIPSTPARQSFSESMIDKIIESAAAMIAKWNPDASTYAKVTSIFFESKTEALQFIKCVNDLQKSMHFLVSENSNSEKLVQAQTLMELAMKRLQKEFYQILSMNRAHLDPESVSTRSSRASARSSTSDYEDEGTPDDEVRIAGDSITEVEEVSSIAMADLKAIAECMISSGYAKECLNIYKIIRKSIIDEGIYRLGVEKISNSHFSKMDWEAIDFRIKNWLEAVKIAMRALFKGERILCDHVYGSSETVRDSCFADISKDGAMLLFSLPQFVAKSKKQSSREKIFRLLDMYTAIYETWPDIESIFSYESTSPVRLQAETSLVRIAESVHTMLSEFQTSIQKESTKSPVAGGGVHSLTLRTMDYLSTLSDYTNALTFILADSPPPENSFMLEYHFDSLESDDSPAPAISLRMAWIILVLISKLDVKAKYYNDVSQSYLFLANNIRHIVLKARTSNLQHVLGERWITKHEGKVKQFAANYERLAWGQVFSSLPDQNSTAEISPAEAMQLFKKFNSSFQEAYLKQGLCTVPDPKLQDDIKEAIANKITPVYRKFYNAHRLRVERETAGMNIIRYAPEEVDNYLSDLFFGSAESSGNSSSSSVFSPSHHRRSCCDN